jgi:hypothetical protein
VLHIEDRYHYLGASQSVASDMAFEVVNVLYDL